MDLQTQIKSLIQQLEDKPEQDTVVDSVQLYIDEFLVEQPDGTAYITVGDVHRHYKDWCEQNGYKPLAPNRLAMALREKCLALITPGKHNRFYLRNKNYKDANLRLLMDRPCAYRHRWKEYQQRPFQ